MEGDGWRLGPIENGDVEAVRVVLVRANLDAGGRVGPCGFGSEDQVVLVDDFFELVDGEIAVHEHVVVDFAVFVRWRRVAEAH